MKLVYECVFKTKRIFIETFYLVFLVFLLRFYVYIIILSTVKFAHLFNLFIV